jgi:hypothetical protein
VRKTVSFFVLFSREVVHNTVLFFVSFRRWCAGPSCSLSSLLRNALRQ